MRLKRLVKFLMSGVIFVGVSILLIGAIGYVIGARVNTTKSIPVGLYWTSKEAVEKGAYVLFCPPDRSVFREAKERDYIGAGFCPGGFGYMMKQILAAKGDAVTVSDDGVYVNGELLPLSAPYPADSDGRLLPSFPANNYILSNTELLLMSNVNGKSFDGRYFGPINTTQVKTVIRPILTW